MPTPFQLRLKASTKVSASPQSIDPDLDKPQLPEPKSVVPEGEAVVEESSKPEGDVVSASPIPLQLLRDHSLPSINTTPVQPAGLQSPSTNDGFLSLVLTDGEDDFIEDDDDDDEPVMLSPEDFELSGSHGGISTHELPDDDDDEDTPHVQFFDLLTAFLVLNPCPTDEQFHHLAVSLGFSPEEMEQKVYSILSMMLENDEIAHETRDILSSTFKL